jgi:inhibitor of KinA sporulation pathway (predicted exonuclease)
MNHVMIDLEMNKIPRQENERGDHLSSELIEIGAVKMDKDYKIIDKYQTYVDPDFGPIDPIIHDLTGITDDMVKGAPKYDQAMTDFIKWVGGDKTAYYSWSMSDIRQFEHESAFKRVHESDVKKMAALWHDFQAEFSLLIGTSKSVKLSDAVASADYTFQGDQHTALADAMNTAEIFILSKHKKEFERVMKPVIDLFRPERPGSTLLEMCPEFFEQFKESGE